MELSELLAIQTELNSHVSGNPSRGDWEMVLLCEIGELCDTLRYGMMDTPEHPAIPGWVWWKRADRPPILSSREVVLEELADILHFVLVGRVLGFVYLPEKDLQLFWSRGWKQGGEHTVPWAALKSFCGAFEGSELFLLLPMVVKSLGFTQEELEKMYIAKVEKNKKRWETAREKLTIGEARKRERDLEESSRWLITSVEDIPELVKGALFREYKAWQKELGEMKEKLDRALDLPLPD